jgi:hypothetical protein
MLNLKGPCDIHGRFSRCKDAPIGICVYCGRRFCSNHGERLPDGSEVCARDNCVAKKLDVAQHLIYKDAAMDRNRSEGRPCGVEACVTVFEVQCNRCRAYFCRVHIEVHEDAVTEDGMQFRRPVPLCRHCWVRRPIWAKT